MTITALGSTSAAVHETASTVDMAAISTLHNSIVARKMEPLPPPPPPPPPPRPGPVPLTAIGELIPAGSEQVPGGSLAGDRGPALDKLATPTDDVTEL